MSNQKPDTLAEIDRRLIDEFAENLRSAFMWRKTPFPELTDMHESCDKWKALYLHLKKFNKKAEENG